MQKHLLGPGAKQRVELPHEPRVVQARRQNAAWSASVGTDAGGVPASMKAGDEPAEGFQLLLPGEVPVIEGGPWDDSLEQQRHLGVALAEQPRRRPGRGPELEGGGLGGDQALLRVAARIEL